MVQTPEGPKVCFLTVFAEFVCFFNKLEGRVLRFDDESTRRDGSLERGPEPWLIGQVCKKLISI